MEILYKKETAVLANATFNGLQALKTRINGHGEHLNVLDKTINIFHKWQISEDDNDM